MSSYIEQHNYCLEHAHDLIVSAERVLAGDNAFINIAYHLAVLAIEEIGKAGLLSAREAARGTWDSTWIDKRLDDHVQKFMWAVWSPSLSSGRIDPKDFEDACRFAESTHRRRMAGLYVNYSDDDTAVPPRDLVKLKHVTSLLSLGKARLELEKIRGVSISKEGAEELEWFLATAADELKRNRLFSVSFIKKYEELGGDPHVWARWARKEFEKADAETKEHLQRELNRQVNESSEGKPKWLMKVRVQTPSHSLRQKTLNHWNERINSVKLRVAGKKGNDLVFEITISDHVAVERLFDIGLSLSRLHLVMLNIGTAGFFWYELSSQAEAYYESIVDLEAPNMNVVVARRNGISREWMEERTGGAKVQRVSLEEVHLESAMIALGVYGSMQNEEAEPIFGPYIQGLLLLSKADVHSSIGPQARDAFITALRTAMHRFGDIDAERAPLVPALHLVMKRIIPEEDDRNQILHGLDNGLAKASVSDAVRAKRAADLYLVIVARRLWPEFVSSAVRDNK